MGRLIDSSLWIDLFREKTLRSVKEQKREEIIHEDACLCGPVAFEVLREARKSDRDRIKVQFGTLPYLPQTPTLWEQATELGQNCRDGGFSAGAVDLMIGAMALEFSATVVTFDSDFAEMARYSDLKVELLKRHS